MAEAPWTRRRRCSSFFLYDRSRVQEEGDPTRAGIYYYYPEDTPLEQQELICGQLAGVSRCVAEISSSPVRLLRLHRTKYAVCMKDDFLWVLSCASDLPDASVCEFLDQLIDLFCFYNGPVRQSYQCHSHDELALHWARYLSHLQGGATELHHVFSCLRTIDYTNLDPLLLLKAALILKACHRCSLVVAGCILYRGRLVSAEMPPELTMKVMVNETEMFSQQDPQMSDSRSQATPSSSTITTPVFLPPGELHALRRLAVDQACSLQLFAESPVKPRLLSRTLSDTPSSAESDSTHRPHDHTPTNGALPNAGESEQTPVCGVTEQTEGEEAERGKSEPIGRERTEEFGSDAPLEPAVLYQHRVKELVLALLVEPDFSSNTGAQQEVYHSSLASLNGLEAHLRTSPPLTPGPQEPYSFAHYDCTQRTLNTNMCNRATGLQDRLFVKATALLHSHFSHTDTLQEAIVRNASCAVFAARNVAQETFFLQQGATARNSGIPNAQDSAFALPSKARHRLHKHGVNLL